MKFRIFEILTTYHIFDFYLYTDQPTQNKTHTEAWCSMHPNLFVWLHCLCSNANTNDQQDTDEDLAWALCKMQTESLSNPITNATNHQPVDTVTNDTESESEVEEIPAGVVLSVPMHQVRHFLSLRVLHLPPFWNVVWKVQFSYFPISRKYEKSTFHKPRKFRFMKTQLFINRENFCLQKHNFS